MGLPTCVCLYQGSAAAAAAIIAIITAIIVFTCRRKRKRREAIGRGGFESSKPGSRHQLE